MFRRPGWITGEGHVDLLHRREGQPDRGLGALDEVWSERTRRSRHAHGHVDVIIIDIDTVDETEVDDVDPELGVDHSTKRLQGELSCAFGYHETGHDASDGDQEQGASRSGLAHDERYVTGHRFTSSRIRLRTFTPKHGDALR